MGAQTRSVAKPAAPVERSALPSNENTSDKTAVSRTILKPKPAITRPALGAVHNSVLNTQKPVAYPAAAAKGPVAGEFADAKSGQDMASIAARKPRVPLAAVPVRKAAVFRDAAARSSYRAPAPADNVAPVARPLRVLRTSSASNVAAPAPVAAKQAPAAPKPAPAALKPTQDAGLKRRASSVEPEAISRVVRARATLEASAAAKPVQPTEIQRRAASFEPEAVPRVVRACVSHEAPAGVKPAQPTGLKRRASSAEPAPTDLKRRASSAEPEPATRAVRARLSYEAPAATVERAPSVRSEATAVDCDEVAARADSQGSSAEASSAESQTTAVEELEKQADVFNRHLAKPGRAFSTLRSFVRPIEREAPRAKEPETVKDWDDIDADDADDPLMVSEYVTDIIEYMRELETKTRPDEHYMRKQAEITWDMRKMLINWIVQIHYQLRMLPETLFLAVNLIDRFLSKRQVSTSKLQLVGLTGLILACKYEEQTTPHVQDFAYLAGQCYSIAEIRNAEVFMLRVLGFDMSFPNPLTFLRRASKAEQYNMQTRTVAKYLMEICLCDHRLMPYVPSHVAAASTFLARRMLRAGPWDANLRHFTGYTEDSLQPCIALMLDHLLHQTGDEFVFRKYQHRRFLKASVFCREWVIRHRHEIPPVTPPVGEFPEPDFEAALLPI